MEKIKHVNFSMSETDADDVIKTAGKMGYNGRESLLPAVLFIIETVISQHKGGQGGEDQEEGN